LVACVPLSRVVPAPPPVSAEESSPPARRAEAATDGRRAGAEGRPRGGTGVWIFLDQFDPPPFARITYGWDRGENTSVDSLAVPWMTPPPVSAREVNEE